MAICVAGIGGILGIFRARAVMRAYRDIYLDLKNAGIKLSQAELQVLIRQLLKNPKAILADDGQEVSHRIKERHVHLLLASLKPLGYSFAALVVVCIVAVLLIEQLWPNQ